MAQANNVTFQKIPFSDPDLRRPGTGLEFWIYQSVVRVPLAASPENNEMDRYDRFEWRSFERGAQGVYDWSEFDASIRTAIDRGQKFAFGIMNTCGGCSDFEMNIDGATIKSFPTYVYNTLRTQPNGVWRASDGNWIPNYNNAFFIQRWNAMLMALANHIANSTYNGVPYSRVIRYIDIRGVGEYNEWHFYPWKDEMPEPVSINSYKAYIDGHVAAFPNFQLVILSDGMDPQGWSGTPPEVIHYLLTSRNNKGPFGWRRDNWGHNQPWYSAKLENNPAVFNGIQLRTLIMDRWRTSPIVGEPLQCCTMDGGGALYYDMPRQAAFYHMNSIGNGNLEGQGDWGTNENMRLAAKTMGFRLTLNGAYVPQNMVKSTVTNVNVDWANEGVSPTYENWDVMYELRNPANNQVVWSTMSVFKPYLFLPGTQTARDQFSIPASVPNGVYNLHLVVRDPQAYRRPMPLFIRNVQADGSYILRAGVNVSDQGGGNIAPVANAGADQTITLPVNTVTLNGSATDADGTVASYAWAKLSGPAGGAITTPNGASTTITGLLAGTYVFRLTATDNAGAVDQDDVTIVVNNAPAPAPNAAPTANAGADRTITLPTSSVTLNGSGTDTDGTIATYAWTKVSGPAGGNIATAAAASTNITGLTAGTYVFRLTVTDNDGAADTDDVQVTVNPAPNVAPTANAGADRTITLPTNSIQLNGTGTDPNGSIVTYAWTKVSGPAGGNIATPAAASTNITGLNAGTYVFRLTVTDNNGATDTDDVQVIVNPSTAPSPTNQAPVANAGADLTITLPVNSVTLNGTATDADGSIASYAWTKLSGPAGGNVQTPAAASTRITAMVAGTYVFRLRVTDNSGAQDTDDVTVIVNPAQAATNQAPIANAGNNITITLPTSSVTLTGAGTDPDGSIAAYSWTKLSGPAVGTIQAAASASTGITGLTIAGTYVFRLTVRDNLGAQSTDDVQVVVAPAPVVPNQAPIANAGTDISITLPVSTATLNGSGSRDADGTIASYVWTKVSGPAGGTFADPRIARPVVSAMIQGTYVFELTVTDDDGARATDRVTVTVIRINSRPVVVSPDTLLVSLPVQNTELVAVDSYDPDGQIRSFAWTYVSGPQTPRIMSPAAARTVVADLVEGTYRFQVEATDNDGAKGSKAVVVIVSPSNGRRIVPDVNVYPNPVSSSVNFQVTADVNGRTLLTFYDANGRPVMTDVFTKASRRQVRQVNISRLPRGTYFVQIQVDQAQPVVEKIVKY